MDDVTHDEIIDLWHRLWRRTTVDPITGCWVWSGAIRKGYAAVSLRHCSHDGHRLAKIVFGDTFDHSLTLDHLCRNRACWRMDHLDPCTIGVNVLRGETLPAMNVAKTHCPQGHPLSLKSGNVRVNAKGGRVCRTCERLRMRATRLKARNNPIHQNI